MTQIHGGRGCAPPADHLNIAKSRTSWSEITRFVRQVRHESLDNQKPRGMATSTSDRSSDRDHPPDRPAAAVGPERQAPALQVPGRRKHGSWVLLDPAWRGVEPGETYERAARRELWEETGIEASEDIGPCVLEQESVGRHADYGNQDIVYRNRHFTVQLRPDEVASLDPSAITRSGYLGHRWWSLDELESTSDPVWPKNLAAIFRQIGRRPG
jgi:8-oxo-dGTP pyrophosphatase MutT (NUDIX family)